MQKGKERKNQVGRGGRGHCHQGADEEKWPCLDFSSRRETGVQFALPRRFILDALGRGTKIIMRFLVGFLALGVHAGRRWQHLGRLRFPCRSICDAKRDGEPDGRSPISYSTLVPSRACVPLSFSLSRSLRTVSPVAASRGASTARMHASSGELSGWAGDAEVARIRLRRLLIDRSESFRGQGNYTTHPLVTIYL